MTDPTPAVPADRTGLPTRARPARPRRTRASSKVDPSPKVPEAADDQQAEQEALELARRIVDIAADKKAADIVLLEVRKLTTLTDYFVICSGGSERQLGAIADGVVEAVKKDGLLPIGREGGPTAHWLLVDYGSVIVHVMATPEREYYALEKLWAEAPLLLRVL